MDSSGPAFPILYQEKTHWDGMSLRDWFAGQVAPSILNHSQSHTGSYDYVATAIGAYQLADAMLKERDK